MFRKTAITTPAKGARVLPVPALGRAQTALSRGRTFLRGRCLRLEQWRLQPVLRTGHNRSQTRLL